MKSRSLQSVHHHMELPIFSPYSNFNNVLFFGGEVSKGAITEYVFIVKENEKIKFRSKEWDLQ